MPDHIQKLNYTHDALAEWLVLNPTASQGDAAQAFGYTEAWISRIVCSDMFQAKYKELCRERGEPAIHALGEKIRRTASLALDKLHERIQGGAGERVLLDTANTLLGKLGYTDKSAQPESSTHFHQHVHLTADDLDRAREKARLLNAREAL